MGVSMPVRCLRVPEPDLVTKTDPTPVPLGSEKLKMNVGATQATLVMVPDRKTGQCPVPMTASAAITTNAPTEIKYRLESDKGELSPVTTVKVDHTLTRFFTIDLTLGPKPSSGGPTVATPTGPRGDLGVTAAVPEPGKEKGFYRLRIVAPNELVSQPATYEVTCLPTAGKGITTAPANPWQEAPQPVLAKAIGPNPPKPDVVARFAAIGDAFIHVAPGHVVTVHAASAKGYRDGKCLFPFQVRVENDGQAPTPGPVPAMVKWDTTTLAHFSVALAAGQGKDHFFDAYVTPGDHVFTLAVDAHNAVAETNELNNSRVTKIRLVGPCGPKLQDPSSAGKNPAAPASPLLRAPLRPVK
jgi:hypothetical protein